MNFDLSDKQEIILQKFITQPDISLDISDLYLLTRQINVDRILNTSKCPLSTTLKPKRDIFTGKIINFIEVPINNAGATARNSMSFKRAPGPSEEIRGNTMNFPFLPGGFDNITSELSNVNKFDFDTDELLTTPPGFKFGYDFKNELKNELYKSTVNLIDMLEEDLEANDWLKISDENNDPKEDNNQKNINISGSIDDTILEETSVNVSPVLEILNSSNTVNNNVWCEIINIDEPIDFKSKIPVPALNFEFELDAFQKHAIVKLEEKKYVFVAAHTSAGKTVVAEYAIALSQKHMTRAIYTSPIKALSNQKYHDFKKKFKDVGLITGDIQIDSASLCLIMTTEILRSMLFCGSDIIRDLEFVVFDEVHYINDADRGHVWEEVIMLLPDHVQIIMLSATVPNTRELADWVGSIKKQKVYVINTFKRPVPLMHYLYTGCGGKSKDDLFLIVDSNGKFKNENYVLAKNVKDSRNFIRSGPKQEQTRWVALINHLKKHQNLPVIAFTLSRNRCDLNVASLKSVDLNTNSEQLEVRTFFYKCLDKLKPNDQKLNQVSVLKDSLERGIGVHHSGILPLLKEIVEMLFHKGLVKVLFATETFAMGVNMPARTVIFDSHFKYDGVEKRNLKPSEYTQMAGRAGRRGLDKSGTVIILCKRGVPDEFALRSIILGTPEPLKSKFVLRYAVILTCSCVERIKVEDILKHSFKQYSSQCLEPGIKQSLIKAENELLDLKKIDKNLKQLEEFFNIANEYVNLKQEVMLNLLSQPNNKKELKPGKILIINHGHHYNKLGIMLSMKIYKVTTFLKVLVLDHHPKYKTESKDDLWHKMLSLTVENKFFSPEGVSGHAIVDIKLIDIVEITKSNIKIDVDLIIKNWEQRQIERFSYDPPSPTVMKAIDELYLINQNYIKKPNSIQIINLKMETNLHNEIDVLGLLKSLEIQQQKLNKILPYTSLVNFEDDFHHVFNRKMKEQYINNLKIKLSPESLSLYPDYRDKLQILRELKYIENDLVTLKGRVASVMGQMELFITELILRNTFDILDPPEIAALLSSLVFQAKTEVKPKIPTKNIENAMVLFQEIDIEIKQLELRYQLTAEKAENLNFGLVEVTYKWATNQPFADIIELTDIQEGIIVRCIQQLDEMIHDIKTALIHLGNRTLANKMDDVSKSIKRDIVFAPSLYTAL